jgi:hypothetical protein
LVTHLFPDAAGILLGDIFSTCSLPSSGVFEYPVSRMSFKDAAGKTVDYH